MEKCRKTVENGKAGPPRAYWHEIILYPDDADTARTLDLIEKSGEEWVAITHDLDTGEGGELKKEHIHVLIKGRAARTASALGKRLMLPPERIELKSNGQGALAYLTHNTEKARLEGKHVYGPEALRGPLAGAAAEAARREQGGASEGVQVLQILDWIEGQDGLVTVGQVARWTAQAGLWATFRRAGVIFRGCLDEHNEAVLQARRAEAQAVAARNGGVDPLAFAKLKAAGPEALPPQKVVAL